MKQEYKEAFSEVYEILKLMPKQLLNKIPSKFYEMIEEERARDYVIEIKEPLEEQNQKLKNETIIILGVIYRDFLCSPEEKKRLQEKDGKELQKLELELDDEIRQTYNPDNIFSNRNKNEKEQIQPDEEVGLVVIQEDKWYKKIFNLIKGLFLDSRNNSK